MGRSFAEHTMQPSRFNIVSRVADSERYFIVNPLSGQADLLEASELNLLSGSEATPDPELVTKGYLVEPEEEAQRLRKAYLTFLDQRETDEVQVFYVPTYACNFTCEYCYQRSYETPAPSPQDAVIAAFFDYLDHNLAGKRKYVTLFGGEPLLPDANSRRVVEQLVEGTRARGLDLAVVTNGYHLADYVELLAGARIREVQVTLDGPREVHDGRRHLANHRATFDSVVTGIEAALARGLPINLRTVMDRNNLPAFAELARFAIERGWTGKPGFKTQVGRNYELHACQVDPKRLYSRLELYQDLYKLLRDNPEVLEFHRPAFSVARYLFDNGKLPSPLFDACPGTKTEWAFDYTGNIYSCTATVGKPGESLGTFYPQVMLDQEQVEPWQERDVLSIDKCQSCNLALACGAGCGSVAKNATGSVLSPDCRPIAGLLELGFSLYGESEAPPS